jgi:hypothetical protein
MRCVIRLVETLSDWERRQLHHWVTRLPQDLDCSEPRVQMRGSSLVAVANDTLANDLAVAAMVVIGRPFYYEVIPIGRAASERRLTAEERQEFGSPATR